MPIQISTSLALRAAPVDKAAIQDVRAGVEWYLRALDAYRESGDTLPIGGRFAEVVKAGLDETKGSGVARKLTLEDLSVERYLVKPWGTPILVEARVTILDRATEGSAPDQRETGKLLLKGNGLRVVDGWDAAQARWFNGDLSSTVTEDLVANSVHFAVQTYVRVESWVPGSAVEFNFFGDADPFNGARAAYLGTLDRSKTTSRLFSEVQATVEKVEAFPDVPEGLATVRLTGTVQTIEADGRRETQAFERRVVVAMLPQLFAMVVDEEMSPGVWLSGGELMATLKHHDRTVFG